MADSTIAQYLNKILEAVYGKDVRQAIYDSISQCYSDVNSPQLTTKAIAAVVQEKIDDGTIPAMTVPLATPNALGGIKADARTSDDILNVRLGDDGHLYAESPTKAIRFKNLTTGWGNFEGLVKNEDYTTSSNVTANYEDGRFIIHFGDTSGSVRFLNEEIEKALTPLPNHSYLMVTKGSVNSYRSLNLGHYYLKAVYDSGKEPYYESYGGAPVNASGSIDNKVRVTTYKVENLAIDSINFSQYYLATTNGFSEDCELEYVMLFDLTDAFGEGNEPSKEEMLTLFNKVYGENNLPYINGTLTFELGGDGSKTISNIIIPDDTGSSGETGNSDSYLKGKSLYVIGDSLTSYSDWGKALCAAEGMTWYNWGFAGTTMAAPETPDYESGHTGVERVRQLPHDDDYVMENMIILIWLGINDTNLGSGADETDIHTLYGGLNDVLSYLTTTFPKTPFGIIGLHRNSNKTVTTTNEIMKQICEKYSVPFFDTEAEGRIIPAYLSDGLHLGANATANIRRRIRQWIKTL